MFPLTVFPGDLVEIEKAAFILCCSRQVVSHKWIGRALDCTFLFGLVLDHGEDSYMNVVHDNEWVTHKKEQKIMYNVYMLGKIVELDERCFRGKL